MIVFAPITRCPSAASAARCASTCTSSARSVSHVNGYPVITSPLGISRWTDMSQITDSGIRATTPYDGLTYWDYNWRKGDGAGLMVDISKFERFYQQGFCGCVYWLRDPTGIDGRRVAIGSAWA